MGIYDDLISGSFSALGMPAAGSPYMTPEERALMEKQIAESQGLQTAVASAPPPAPAPWQQPPAPDTAMAYAPQPAMPPALAAASGIAAPGANHVTAGLQPRDQSAGGGLLELLFGPSKNGAQGLPGLLLGGGGAGGLLGLIMSGRKAPGSAPASSPSQSNSGNLMGTSSHGRRYDLDRNEWI